jgi:galactokinase
MISSLGQENHALLIDCRTLEFNLLPLPKQVRVIILDTATRRGLVDSAYNERVAQCRTAAEKLGIPSLRDITLDDFHAKADSLDELTQKRALHVISENERTLKAAKALQKGDVIAFGHLMSTSHISLRDDYEVSSPELNIMVELARQEKGCLGARMTGAGFGGCAVALVEKDVAEKFAENIRSSYQEHTELQPNIYICEASNGVKVLD